MQTIPLVLLVAGITVFLFLLLALVAWSFRIRREEDGFIPAPPRPRRTALFQSEESSRPVHSEPIIPPAEPVHPVEARIPEEILLKPETGSVVQKILGGVMPELSVLVELGKMGKEITSRVDNQDFSAADKAEIVDAVAKLLQERPDSPLLNRIQEGLMAAGFTPEAIAADERVQVYRIGAKTEITVDGKDYYSVEEVPDPEMRRIAREKIRKLKFPSSPDSSS